MKYFSFYFLLFATSILATEVNFDEKYAVEITQCNGNVYSPTIYDYYHSDFWGSVVSIHFGNGLLGKIEMYAKNKFHAKQYSEWIYSGRVNVLVNEFDSFYILQEGSHYPTKLTSLLVGDFFSKIENLPKVKFVKEEVEVQSSWIYRDSYKYHYTIGLSDNTIWKIIPRTKPLQDPWLFEDQVILIGNREEPCLINFSASSSNHGRSSIIFLKALPEQGL